MLKDVESYWRKAINKYPVKVDFTKKKKVDFTKKKKEGIYWCDECNVPLLTDICDIHGSFVRYVSYDLKPVFQKEKKLIESDLGIKLPDHRFLFRVLNRLICSGKTLLRLKPLYLAEKSKSEKYTFTHIETKTEIRRRLKEIKNTLSSINPQEYIIKIYESNETYFCNLIRESEDFINSVIKEFKPKNFYISFSGGKDSTVVAMLLKNMGIKIPLFFSDTTLEYEETYEFIETFAKQYDFSLIDYKKYSSHQNFYDLCKELGPPSMFYRWCCTVFKAYPVNKFYQEIDGEILTFDGIRKKESSRRKDYEQISRIKKIPKQIATYPIFNWNEYEVWLYILFNEILYNPIYELGISRVGCHLCPAASPYNCHFRKKTKYDIWEPFEDMLYKYARRAKRKTINGTHINWVDLNYWRLRRPKKDILEVGLVKRANDETIILPSGTSQQMCNKDNSYLYTIGNECISDNQKVGRFSSKKEIKQAFNINIDEQFLEFLKPFGIIEFKEISSKRIFQITNPKHIYISGFVNDSKMRVSFKIETDIYKKLFDKQFLKAINCVGCGGCIGMCPNGAISIQKSAFHIEVSKCNNCLLCVKSNFISTGCIAVNFNLRKKVLKSAK